MKPNRPTPFTIETLKSQVFGSDNRSGIRTLGWKDEITSKVSPMSLVRFTPHIHANG